MALFTETRKRPAGKPVYGEHVGADEPAGYYVAGHDWPAIENDIEIGDIYEALRGINDEQVDATGASLLQAAPEPDVGGAEAGG